MRACHLTMFGIYACNEDCATWKFILEARKEREPPKYSCFEILWLNLSFQGLSIYCGVVMVFIFKKSYSS